MAGSLTNLIYHIIFSTKNREKLIVPELRKQLYPYIGGIIHGENGRLLKIGGMAEHVHLLTVLPASISLSEMLRRIKGNSSKWVNDKTCLWKRVILPHSFRVRNLYVKISPGDESPGFITSPLCGVKVMACYEGETLKQKSELAAI